MKALLGIDLGTSSVKVVVSSMKGAVEGLGKAEYPILLPSLAMPNRTLRTGGMRRSPRCGKRCTRRPLLKFWPLDSRARCTGSCPWAQTGQPVRPAIIWADQRSAELLPEIQERIGTKLLATTCGTAPAAGFMISTLAWMQKYDPKSLDRIATLLMPKDYVRFRLTERTRYGSKRCRGYRESSTWHAHVWADKVIDRLGFPRSIFPEVHPSAHIVGSLAKALQLSWDCRPESRYRRRLRRSARTSGRQRID